MGNAVQIPAPMGAIDAELRRLLELLRQRAGSGDASPGLMQQFRKAIDDHISRTRDALFRDLLENAPDAMIAVDEAGRIELINEHALAMFGYERGELVGQSVELLVPESARAIHECHRRRYMAAPTARPMEARPEFSARKKDGSEFHVEISLGPVRTEHGLLISAAIRDITRRRQAEEAMRQSEERFRLLVEGAKDYALFLLDPEGIIVSWNSGAQRIKGYEAHEIIGRSSCGCYTPEDVAAGKPQKALEIAARGGRYEMECWIVRKDGSRFWASTLITALRNEDGSLRGFAELARDITERKRIEQERERFLEQARAAREQAEQANRAKDQFLAVLSHELRTPLAPVLATIALIEAKTDLPSDVRDEVHVIHRNVELEARLIDDLLDLTRISRGKIELHYEVLDLHTAIQQTLEICQADMQMKKLEVSMSLWAERHWAWADPGRVQQVLWNLLKNAIKFTPEHGRVALRTSGTDNERVRIEISDSGVGIEPDLLPRLFTAFEQGSKDTTRQFGGLGLGLAISKAIVDLHGGTITATSQGKGKGATFTVELATTEAMVSAAPSPAPAARPKGRRVTILFVEDNDDTRRVMAQLLRASGYTVKTAASVREALEALEKERIDLLVSDLGLPDGTGYEIMRNLRQRGDIKGIALSGYGMEEDIARSMESGFSRHLTKPVKPQELNAVISELVTA